MTMNVGIGVVHTGHENKHPVGVGKCTSDLCVNTGETAHRGVL